MCTNTQLVHTETEALNFLFSFTSVIRLICVFEFIIVSMEKMEVELAIKNNVLMYLINEVKPTFHQHQTSCLMLDETRFRTKTLP